MLGENDPCIILPDVYPKKIVPEIFWAALIDVFRDALVEFTKTIKVGNGTDPDSQLGPVQNINQYKKVFSFFEDAHANKYKFAVGGDVNPNPTNGLFVPVSFVDNPPEDSMIVQEEPFGPIVLLLKWSDEKDVIKRASVFPKFAKVEL
ncbi:aldehyde dehydrogenase family protein [Ceratobasidium sp. AG-Ba]|nr:aldehyde dehydrogenase family protein [Ceratobasidium sp. AG-Ba]QRW13040.1 aldehyde dehydrogenase family protein [Ceratobasidium sp. AG-Ba]